MWLVFANVAAAQSWSTLDSGVEYAQWTNGDPNRISALRIDLCKPGLRMRATTTGERGQKTSSWASSVGVTAATNGGFFTSGYAPDQGRAMGEGAEWPDSTDSVVRGWMAFGEHTVAHWPSGYTADLPAWADQAVNGDATLVSSGAAVDCGGCGSGRAPRTAAAYSEDGRTLWLVAVDGRSSSSAGMTIDELAVLMASLGVDRAMNLDGGGSTTMWTASGGVVNDPSDGSERTVGNHLGVYSPGVGLAHHCPTGFAASWGELDFEGASGATLTAPAGSVVSGTMRVTNSGTETWDPALTRLAPLPRDTPSAVAADGWIASHRVVGVRDVTAPGEVGAFDFAFQMPDEVGTSTRWEFSFLHEGVAWFGNSWGPEDGTFYLTLVTTEPVVDTDPPDSDPPDSEPPDSDPPVDSNDPDRRRAEGLPWRRQRLASGCAVASFPSTWASLMALALIWRRRCA